MHNCSTKVCYTYVDQITQSNMCTDGEVRLVGGSNQLEGRVEICINKAWGTVCDNGFNQEDAVIICDQLKVPYESEPHVLHELLSMSYFIFNRSRGHSRLSFWFWNWAYFYQ